MSSIEPANKYNTNKKQEQIQGQSLDNETNNFESLSKLAIAISEVDADKEVNSPKERKSIKTQSSNEKKPIFVDSKRKMLKKNAFEQDQALSLNQDPSGTFTFQQTGRFITEQENFSKSANQAKLLSVINQEVEEEGKALEFDSRLNNTENENEMRETSYFKQQTDDENLESGEDPKNKDQIISISNQKEINSKNASEGPGESNQTTNNESAKLQKRMSGFANIVNDEKTSNNSNLSKNHDGVQMFKISSRSQMKQRAQRASKKNANGLVINENQNEQYGSQMGESNAVGSPLNFKNFDTPISPTNISGPVQNTKSLNNYEKKVFLQENTIFDADGLMRSQSFKLNGQNQNEPVSPLIVDTKQKTELKLQKHQVNLVSAMINLENSSDKNISEEDLHLIQQNKIQQQQNVNVTGNFGHQNDLNLQKQMSQETQKHNYSVLKGPKPDVEDETEMKLQQQQMFTSMSDIGFPSNIHQKQNQKKHSKKTGEIITTEQIQKMMDTQNNWRVRTMTIDELLHDIKDRIETDKEYILINSEKLIDFFIQLLTDQNFKIVLNTLNILNMIIGIKEQQQRHEKLFKQQVQEPWGISNAKLSRYIPQIVKKLADSKNINRQEAFKCLFSISEIMKSGIKKDNNFIALILPYLNNSSSWHIREELLNLLIKCFLKSQDKTEFDAYQILDSILQLFNDNKEKIRNLALEAIAAFASIGYDKKINEILFQLKVDKDICDLIKTRFEYGMFPFINKDGNVEIPYQQDINYEVDSVAHNMSSQNGDNIRRKQSIGGNSVHSNLNSNQQKNRGNSSGRKIVVTTAKVTNQQLGISTKDEMMQQIMNSKRTVSANNPNQLKYEGNQIISEPGSATLAHKNHLIDPLNYSVGKIHSNNGQGGLFPMFDDMQFQAQDLNSSSFLPQLQKINAQIQGSGPQSYQSQNYAQLDRDIGSSGAIPQAAFEMTWDNNFDPHLNSSNYYKIPISGSSKRSNNYLHGTPQGQNHGNSAQQYHQRDNSGKMSSHNMNFSISNQSPSLYQQPRGVKGQDVLLVNDQFDIMSNATGHTNYAQYHQTPGSNKDQILLSAGGYREGSGNFNHGDLSNFTTLGQVQGNIPNQYGFTPQPHMGQLAGMYNYNHSHKDSGVADPGFSDHNIDMFKEHYSGEPLQQQYQQRIMQQHLTGAKKNQATFYSDGTTFTAQTSGTATTGATSKVAKKMNKGHNLVENQQQQFQHQMNQERQSLGPGPVKATRAILMNQNNMFAQEELCIDARDNKKSKSTGKHKHNQKLQNSQDVKQLKREQDDESADEQDMNFNNVYNRSFSHIEKNQFGFDKQNQGLNQEDQDDPALITQSSKIQYESTEELEPLEKPEKQFTKCIKDIQSPDWCNQFEACNIIRRVCKHHQSLILQTGNIQNLVNTLLKLAESLRSAVSRIALMTLADMFHFLKRVIEPFLLSIVKILLKKGTDTNHFIAEEADKCLRNMVENCQESKVLQIIIMQNTNSRSNLQRLKICQCLMQIVKSLGNNILFFKENDKLLVQLAKYLQDASQDVRQVAKNAFIAMSQAIMGQNELEKLLQRVLNEAQYQKVKEFLDKEPTHLIQNHNNNDFLITNANKADQYLLKKSNRNHKASIKNLRNERLKPDTVQADQQDLKIESKSILNPAFLGKNESSGFLNRVAQQKYKLEDDQMFNDAIKDLIMRSQVNEWKIRLECSEALFEMIRENIERFSTKQYKNVELADALCKLLTDQNVKIQIICLEHFNKIFSLMFQFVENFIQLFYKSIISNLGSSHIGVRKNSEQLLKQISDNLNDKQIIVQPLMNMIQYNSNARLKPALIDQLLDILEYIQERECQSILTKIVLPVGFKLLDDNKNEVKTRVEKLFKKLYQIIGQPMLDQCPQMRLQRVCDICLSSQQKNLNGTGSSGKNSYRQTGNFGANGSSLPLNSRI